MIHHLSVVTQVVAETRFWAHSNAVILRFPHQTPHSGVSETVC